jgi:hypothetical protein
MHRSELILRHPCPRPDKQLRNMHCDHCDRDVIDLARLTEREVRALKKRALGGERICVRYRVDGDGLIQLRRPPRPVRTAAVAAGLAALLACGAARADTSVPQAKTAASAKKSAATVAKAKAKEPPPPPPPAVKKLQLEDQIDGGI